SVRRLPMKGKERGSLMSKSACIAFRMQRASISRDLKATRFAGVNSTAPPGFCKRKRTAYGQAHSDGQIVQTDIRHLSLVARQVKSNLTVRKLTGCRSM